MSYYRIKQMEMTSKCIHPATIATQWRDMHNRMQALRSIRIQATYKPKPCKGGIIDASVIHYLALAGLRVVEVMLAVSCAALAYGYKYVAPDGACVVALLIIKMSAPSLLHRLYLKIHNDVLIKLIYFFVIGRKNDKDNL